MPKSPIFFEIHSELPREGPGDSESTQKAFSIAKEFLPEQPNILDIGCGPGMQTILLGEMTDGKIIALDPHQPFLDELSKKSKEVGFSSKITPVQGSMFEMNFPQQSFDLIWAEGAIFIIGFEKGLKEWKKFLKPNGLIAVSHLSWIKDEIPEEPKKFWAEKMPDMTSVEKNIKIMKGQGYKVLSHFTIPESAWWNDYYTPMENRLKMLRERYKENPENLKYIEDTQRQIDIYRKFSDSYGYVFYVAQLE